jgi:hypothetical protein
MHALVFNIALILANLLLSSTADFPAFALTSYNSEVQARFLGSGDRKDISVVQRGKHVSAGAARNLVKATPEFHRKRN